MSNKNYVQYYMCRLSFTFSLIVSFAAVPLLFLLLQTRSMKQEAKIWIFVSQSDNQILLFGAVS